IKALSKKYEFSEAPDGEQGLEIAIKTEPDIIITDMMMPGMNGLELLGRLTKLDFNPVTIFITGYGNEKIAVDAMKSGAFDYISKPFDIDELRMVVRNASDKVMLLSENKTLRRQIQKMSTESNLIGESEAIRKILELTKKTGEVDISVLITGESGTGKELIAQSIHQQSARSANRFVTFNCAALPTELIESELFGHEKGAFTGAVESRMGKFEAADKGTLFLDEIGDMATETQAKILRVLQEGMFERLGSTTTKKADVRIVSATNKDLESGIKEGWFRSDLYYRINVVQINLPPLSERRDDIPLLIEYFLGRFNIKHSKNIESLTPDAMSMLINSDWPGNVRELMNAIEKAVALSDSKTLTLSEFESKKPSRTYSNVSSDDLLSFREQKKSVVDGFEKEFFISALLQQNGNISRAAEQIGLRRQYLQDKLKKLGIDAREFKE
ncbi:sigma-54-dependent Fis family transcriptional regulator, partial [Candidatus Marinimicrobia bacterium MT.SAG.4]